MDFLEVVKTRFSVRSYSTNKKITKAELMEVFSYAKMAPSAVNKQPWEVIVVEDGPIREKVNASYPRDWICDAQYIIIVIGKRGNAWTRKHDEYNSLETDLTIFMDHLILTATNFGYGTCWIEAYNPNILKEALNLAPNEEVFSITTLGYPKDDIIVPKKSRKDPTSFVKFL